MYCEDKCAGQTCNGGGSCSPNVATGSYTCKCDSGFNGVDCVNSKFYATFILNLKYLYGHLFSTKFLRFFLTIEYFTCPSIGTFADPLYCYKYIFCSTTKGILTTKTNSATECPIVSTYELVFDGTKCTFPQLFTRTTNCALKRV